MSDKLFAVRIWGAVFGLSLFVVTSAPVVGQDHGTDDHAADADHGDEDHDAKGHGEEDHHGESGGEHHDDNGHGDGDHGHEAPPFKEDLAFWSIIAFAGFILALYKLGIIDWLHTSMAAREDEQNDVISVAEGHLAEAQASLNQYRGQLEAMDETVAETLAEAGRDADHTRGEIVELAESEAKSMVKRAEVEIGRARDQSLHNLFSHLAARVAEAAESRMRQNLQADDQDRLIDDTLNQLANS